MASAVPDVSGVDGRGEGEPGVGGLGNGVCGPDGLRCKVTDWTGEFEMRESQAMAWQQLPLDVAPVLPGALPVLAWLVEERGLPASAAEAVSSVA